LLTNLQQENNNKGLQ